MVFERLGVVGETARVRFVLDRAVVLAGEQVGDGAPVIPEESICTGHVADDVAGKRGQPGQRVVSAQFAEAVAQLIGEVLWTRLDAVAEQRVDRRRLEAAEIRREVAAELATVELVDLETGGFRRRRPVGRTSERGTKAQDPP